MNAQIKPSVFSFPLCAIDCVSVFRIKLTTGLPDCCARPAKVVDPVLNINSKNGINMPIDVIEKIIESIVHKK